MPAYRRLNTCFTHLLFYLRERKSSSIYRNATSLVISNFTTAVGGYLFWIIAARRYEPALIGIVSAILSAMTLIDLISNFGVSSSMIRFLPSMQSYDLIHEGVSIRIASSFLVSFIFLIGLPIWAPGLKPVYTIEFWLIFLLLNLTNSLFTFYYGVFIALRNTHLLLVNSLLVNALKFMIILLLPASSDALGLTAAVTIPLILAVALFIFFFLPSILPSYAFRLSFKMEKIKKIAGYALSNQISEVLINLPQMALPILVINSLGPQANAWFYTSFMTASILRTAGFSISQVSLAERSLSDSKSSKGILGLLVVLIVGGLILGVFAPEYLLIFGRSYSQEGAFILRVLLVAALPYTIMNLQLNNYRMAQALKFLLIISTLWAIISMSFSILGLMKFRLEGLTVGWTLGQIVAVIIPLVISKVSKR